MVSVLLRNGGEGIWRPMSLPVTSQLAQTLAAAARTLDLADQVRIQPSSGQRLDVRV